MTFRHAFAAALLLLAAVAARAQSPTFTVTTTAPTLSSPEEQIRYARGLLHTTVEHRHGTPEWKEAYLTMITALEVVPRNWPNNKAAVAEALLLEAELFHQMDSYSNVLTTTARVDAVTRGTPSALIAAWWRAKALDRLNRNDEAEEAFAKATGPGFASVDDGHQQRILNDASWFHERRGRYALASDELRQKAKIEQGPVMKLETMLRSINLNVKLSDNGRAKDDLRELDRLVEAARGDSSLAPLEREALERAARHVDEYHRKLHS